MLYAGDTFTKNKSLKISYINSKKVIIENFFINEVYVTVNNWSIPVDNFFIGRTIKVWKVHKKIVLHLKYGCLFLQ